MMLTPCGPSTVPTGGAGVALPAGSSIFSVARTFFFPIDTPYGLPLGGWSADLLDLQEVELHRGLAAEHVDEHLQDALDFLLLERNGLVARPHEARHPGRVAHDVPGLVGHVHAHQDVPGEDPLLDVAALAVLDLDLVLH